MKKNNKGITLIALVITIIVLLILAGITIATLTGENGLLNRATQAKDKTTEGEILDEIGLAYNSAKIDSLTDGTDIVTALKNELSKKDNGVNVAKDGNNLNVTNYRGYDATINTQTGEITLSGGEEAGAITITEFSIAGTPVEEANIPVPTEQGFRHVEGTTKDSGYVIENETTGDQFVWVPVDKNQKITLKVSSKEPITEMKLYDPLGEEISLGTVGSTSYENTAINPTINGGYKVEITTANETKTQTLAVRSLYAVDNLSDYFDDPNNFDSILNIWDSRLGSPGNKADIYQRLGNLEDDEAFIAYVKHNYYNSSDYSEPTDTIDYEDRVATNGGFYIGRYEASYSSSKALSKPSTKTSNTNWLTDGMLWNFINQTDALSTAKAYNSTLNSSLLTGAAWDRTLGWLVETGNKDLTEIGFDSTSWGNYNDDMFSNNTSIANTGEYSQTKANNIYDLAGNVWEWTTEVGYASGRVQRGGGYNYNGSYFPASGRSSGNPSSTYHAVGFRLALYL